jgi:hypothetical protein
MQVRLTKEGQKALGFSPDRIIASVSDNRAFAMMSNGMANPDKGFMALFDGEIPKLIEVPKPKLTNPEKQQKKIDEIMKPKSKKEKATSKRAANRKKAIKK